MISISLLWGTATPYLSHSDSSAVNNNISNIHVLQTEKRQLEEEVKGAQSVHDDLQKEQLKQNKTSEELLEHYRCEIEEVKLKHRKLIRFENQLMQLIEQHKQLDYVFVSFPYFLSLFIENKQVKLAQLHKLDEELEEAKKQKQFETEDAQIHE
uniref:Uncharacterized protein n=1 Tax=Xiphophorus couchianus TaxID=32473 RepID=A0A3B5MTU7_9TELE